MALNPSNNSNMEELALKGLRICRLCSVSSWQGANRRYGGSIMGPRHASRCAHSEAMYSNAIMSNARSSPLHLAWTDRGAFTESTRSGNGAITGRVDCQQQDDSRSDHPQDDDDDDVYWSRRHDDITDESVQRASDGDWIWRHWRTGARLQVGARRPHWSTSGRYDLLGRRLPTTTCTYSTCSHGLLLLSC